MSPAVRGAAARRPRLAELTSGLGAGILGLGIGILAADYLRGLALPLLLSGILLHAWGMMVEKHRLERTAGADQPWWSTPPEGGPYADAQSGSRVDGQAGGRQRAT